MKYRSIAVAVLLVSVALVVAARASVRLAQNRVVVDLRNALTFEYATTTAEQELGLGERDALPDNTGMLFFFGAPEIRTFWMKGMRFPLDIIWINQNVVVDVVTLQPPKDGDLIPPWHTSLRKADRVLEINAGKAAALGLKTGVAVLTPR